MGEYLVDCKRTQFAAVRVFAGSEDEAVKRAEEAYNGTLELTPDEGMFFWEDDAFEAYDAQDETVESYSLTDKGREAVQS